MTPCRGLSMSAMKKNEMDSTIGRMTSNQGLEWRALYPVSVQEHIAIMNISSHAPSGMRFHQEACV